MLRLTDTKYHCAVMLFIILVGIALYGHTLEFPFNYDTKSYVESNPLIQTFGYYDDLLHPFRFAQVDNALGIHQDYVTNFALRPVSYLTFSLNYWLDGFHPAGYRFVNIAIHIVNAMLIYLCLTRLMTVSPKADSADIFSTRFIPAVSALLFLIHPLQTESVVYVAQRFTSLATLFYLLTVLLYLYGVTTSSTRNASIFRAASVAALLAGMLTKEIVFTAPLMLVLIELVVLGSSLKTAAKRTFLHLACLPVIPIFVMVMAAAQNQGHFSVLAPLNIVNYASYSPISYATTQLSVVTTYIRLLLLPYNLNVDPDYPLFTSILQGRVIISLVIISLLICASFALFRSMRRDIRSSLIFFGTLWFFLAVSVSSSIVPLPDLMAEHRAYLGSVGIFVALAALVDLCRSRLSSASSKNVIIIFMMLWGVVLCGATFARIEVWRSEINLWKDSVTKSPLKVRPWHNLGISYLDESRFDDAVICFQKAIALDSKYLLSYRSLGYAYNKLGMFHKAIDINISAIDQGTEDPHIYCNLGIAYYNIGQLSDAQFTLEQAMGFGSRRVDGRVTLATIYYLLGDTPSAAKQLRLAEQANPTDSEVLQQIVWLKSRIPNMNVVKQRD